MSNRLNNLLKNNIYKIRYFIDKYQVGTKLFFWLLLSMGLGLFIYGLYILLRPKYILEGTINTVNCSNNNCILNISFVIPITNKVIQTKINVISSNNFTIGNTIVLCVYKDNLYEPIIYDKREQLFNSIIYIIIGICIIFGIILSWMKS